MIVSENDNLLEIRFPYHPAIIKRIKEVNGRRWNPEKKCWTIPKESLSIFLQAFPNAKFEDDMQKEVKLAQQVLTKDIPDTPIVDYEFKTKPFKHQIQGFNFGVGRQAALIADDMGLGKSKESIDIAEYRIQEGQVKKILVVTKATLKFNWEEEIKKHGKQKAVVVEGTNKTEKINILYDAYNDPAIYYIICNYEQIRDYQDKYTNLKWDMVICDEVHKIKNHKSGIGKSIQNIKAPYKIALTGTPIINRPEELYNIIKWLGIENRGYRSFCKEYCELGGYTGWDIIGYQEGALEKIAKSLRNVMIRRLKEEVLDLPDKIYRTLWVEMKPEQQRVYDKIESEVKAEIFGENGEKEVINPSIVLTKLLRLKQACGSLELLGGKPISAKIDAVKDLVEEITETNNKCIIFTQFRGMYKALGRELQQFGVTGLRGDMTSKQRKKAVNAFQNNPDIRVFIGMSQACREGLTLTSANHVIFVDLEWAPAYVAQATDRAHRIGQNKNVIVTKVMAKNSIDEAILDLLEAKQVVFDGIVEGNEEAMRTLKNTNIKKLLRVKGV